MIVSALGFGVGAQVKRQTLGRVVTPGPERELELLRRCDEALYFLWDPIGVRGHANARDEYARYVPRVFEWVKLGDFASLAGFLSSWGGPGALPSRDSVRETVAYLTEARALIERPS